METLIHEDIYVYLDEIITQNLTKQGKTLTFVNDSIKNIADIGVFEISIKTGSFTGFKISIGENIQQVTLPLSVGDKLHLDLRKKIFKKNGKIFLADNYLTLKDNSYVTIHLDFIGDGSAETSYSYNLCNEAISDLMFVESVSIDENIDRPKKTNIKNKEKFIKSEKKSYTFSINLLCNEQTEIIPDEFRLRLIDIDEMELETLSICRVDTRRKGSSSGSDYTYELSGSAEKIF